MPLVKVCAVLLLILASQQLPGQTGRWTPRLAISGIGTSDRGVFFISPDNVVIPATFVFGNGWGATGSMEYALSDAWHAGVTVSYSEPLFDLDVCDSLRCQTFRGRTSFAPVLAHVAYRFRHTRRFQPHVGITAGAHFPKTVRPPITSSIASKGIRFRSAPVYGVVLGFDLLIGEKGLFASCQIRSLTFDYTVIPDDDIPPQTPLDQEFYQNYNHIALGIGLRL